MRKIISIFVLVFLLCACSSIDCTVADPISIRYGFYEAYNDEDVSLTLTDTLTIQIRKPVDKDTTLVNRAIDKSIVSVPVSYMQEYDKLVFKFKSEHNLEATDTLYVYKHDIAHFESVDCNPVYFHTIEDVKVVPGLVIKDVKIKDPNVTFNATTEQIQLYIEPLE